MEVYYVYIIKSTSKFIYYKGSSSDPNKRLKQHNNNESRFTSGKGSWVLVFVSKFENKREALIEEKRLKKCNAKYLEWMMEQDYNLLKSRID